MVDKEVLMDGAVVTDEELPLDANRRMIRLIQRVKDEYHFNKMPPDFDVSSEFKLVEVPEAEERILCDSLSTATIEDEECLLKGANLRIYGAVKNQPLLLRTAYFDIFELILDGLQIDLPNYHNLVIGSPGIGTSFFHAFCLYVLIKANAPVFFQREEYSALCYEGKVYECKVPLSTSTLLSRSNIWVLYDRIEPPTTIFRRNVSIMVSSPKKARYWDYLKNSGCQGPLYMPLWNFAELMHINPHLPVELKVYSVEDLKMRFEFCGGVPRYIFNNFSSFESFYTEEISEVEMEHLYIKEGMDFDDVCEYILALQVPENYFECKLDFLSRKIAAEVKDILQLKKELVLSDVMEEFCDYEAPFLL